MRTADLALQRNKYKHLSDDEWRWLLQQTEGRERTADKLPTFAAMKDWWYPVRLSCEQCSSEATARYKKSIVESLALIGKRRFADLTGGYGVDTYFLSDIFAHTDYVEQNDELCRIAEHNLKGPLTTSQKGKEISIHHCTAEEFLQTAGQYDLMFADPARRDNHGGKVFRLADCTPDVTTLLPTLLTHLNSGGHIMLKLSPMLDISQAQKELQAAIEPSREERIAWEAHVVAVKNEVKEVMLTGRKTKSESHELTITAIDLAEPEKAFVFTREDEQEARSALCHPALERGYFLYEPNAAILKSGAYKLAGERFGLQKLDISTHLYTSERPVYDFPGRIWRIETIFPLATGQKITQANIITRNYPLTPDQVKKKLKIRDGGEDYIIGCRVNGKPALLHTKRIQ